MRRQFTSVSVPRTLHYIQVGSTYHHLHLRVEWMIWCGARETYRGYKETNKNCIALRIECRNVCPKLSKPFAKKCG